MKIRTKLTLFFMLMFIFLFISFSFWFYINLKNNYIEKDIDKKLTIISSIFMDHYKLYSKIDIDFIKNIKFDFIFPPINYPKIHAFNDKIKEFDSFIQSFWVAIIDDKYNILNQSESAKIYPVDYKRISINKEYQNYAFYNMSDNGYFPVNNRKESIVRLKFIKINDQNIKLYVVFLMPITDEFKFLDESRRLIIQSLIFLIFLITILGLVYSNYSLNPINKVITDLNKLSKDDLSKRIQTDNSKDEIGKLIFSLNNLLARLEKGVNLEKQFISDISHEFKTPIFILRLNIESLINNNKLSNKELDNLTISLDILYSLSILIQKTMSLSRLELGLAPFRPEKMIINNTLNLVYETLLPIAVNKKLKLTFDNNKEIEYTGDKDLLYMAFFNIIENAIKYTNEGKVNISFNDSNNDIEINIEDTGIGISENEKENIFARFYRIDNARSENKGYGIGLTIAKRIIDIHKGIIEIDSKLNHGTKFKIILKNKN
jgi:signal transduction histidine kinase